MTVNIAMHKCFLTVYATDSDLSLLSQYATHTDLVSHVDNNKTYNRIAHIIFYTQTFINYYTLFPLH